jgi:prophage regulatory protein
MKVLNKRELRAKTTISIQHITRLEKLGRFPKRIQLTQNRVGWLESEVDEWLEQRVAERNQSR